MVSLPVELSPAGLPAGYGEFLDRIKERIGQAQTRAALAASRELLRLYWQIGREIVLRQETEGWGASVIERLAADLRRSLPGVAGFSASNIWRMRAFYLAYRPPDEVLAQAAREMQGEELPSSIPELPWGHHIVLLERVKDPAARDWYGRSAIEHGWSRAILVHQIEADLYRRTGRAVTNFEHTLPPPQSDLAQQALKDPYVFDFLTLSQQARERELEQGLIDHVQRFLLELGAGFAFVGRQVHLEVGGEDFFIDLLFYHLHLRCFVVVELKATPFRPEFAGKMNFYLSAVDDLMRHPDDKPSIGLLLCKSKDRLIVEYALRDVQKPIGVAQWEARLVASLPEELKGSLPTVEELERELGRERREE